MLCMSSTPILLYECIYIFIFNFTNVYKFYNLLLTKFFFVLSEFEEVFTLCKIVSADNIIEKGL